MVGQAILQFLLLIVGFVLLIKGADWFVDGASGIAAKLKVSTFVIGLTVVALGTSAPEAAVSVVGAIRGTGDVIIGNVLGSNILNILLILGITSLITQIPVEKSSRMIEIPFLIAITAAFVGLGLIGNQFNWWNGIILLVLYAVFMTYTVIMANKQKAAIIEESSAVSVADTANAEITVKSGIKVFFAKISALYENLKQRVWFLILLTLVGLGLVVGGAELVVNSASFIAQEVFGIPEMVVGLTVVAFGTSLPELVTSISAARKGDMGIATGNIIGSNLANLLFVAGLGFVCSGANPIAVTPLSFIIDCAVSVLAALLLLVFSFGKRHSLGKPAGITFLCVLAVYYVYLFLSAFGVIVL